MNLLNSAHHIAFVGGFTDRMPWNRTLLEQYQQFKVNFPHKTIAYFDWTQSRAIEDWLKHYPHSSIVGHSYGGDTAASVVAKGASVTTLVTIDPVSRFRPSFKKVASHCQYWANYLAIGHDRGLRSTQVNLVAKFGGHWMHQPKQYCDEHVVSDQHDHMTICPFVLSID
jgi:pimeloyl-ACP methyl ester carboxylesterase